MEKSEYSAAEHWEAIEHLIDAVNHWRAKTDMYYGMWLKHCDRVHALEDRVESMKVEIEALLNERDSYKAALDAATGGDA